MPIPVLIVFSWKKRATDIGEEILTEIERALKTFGVEWGLGAATPWTTVEVRSSELLAFLPDTPYYSCHFYIWRGKDAVVTSPWWLPPAIAAVSSEGLLIDDIYVWGKTAWNYSLDYKTLHASVWRAPARHNATNWIQQGRNLAWRKLLGDFRG